MSAHRHKGKIFLIVLVLVVSLIYWDDPWLWRKYVQFFSSGDPLSEETLRPAEEISGDGSYVLPVAVAEDRVISQETLDDMHEYAAEFGSHSLIVVHKGVIQDEWYADYWDRDNLTQSQSMHKSLLALFVGMAIEDGKFRSVEDPIGLYIEEWADDPRGDITLRNLMYMSSGLGQYAFTLNPFDDGMKWLNSGRSIEPILRTPLADWEQGAKWDYNNINSELLGIALERVYGMRYSELLRERLWLPMGGERALVHTDSPGGRAYTSCCLGAPAMDWVRVGMLLLNRGEVNGNRIVSSEWIDEMRAAAPMAGFYGYQVWLGYDDPIFPPDQLAGSSGAIAPNPFLARDTWMTWGRGQQHVYVVPSQELIILRMGPALGRQPIKPGYDISYLVNTALSGMQ
jgi:CubicO group peptidase (beta-lactamase class C family)